jgi:transcriptional regulator with XRE-family HTH domain
MTANEYKAERKRRGLSQVALATAVGVTQPTISDRETNRREITREAELAILSLSRPKTKGQNALQT